MRPIEMHASWVCAVRAVESCLRYMGQGAWRDYKIYAVTAVLAEGAPKKWSVRKHGFKSGCRQLLIITGRTTTTHQDPFGHRIHAQVDVTPFREGASPDERMLRVTMLSQYLDRGKSVPVQRAFRCGETGYPATTENGTPLPFAIEPT